MAMRLTNPASRPRPSQRRTFSISRHMDASAAASTNCRAPLLVVDVAVVHQRVQYARESRVRTQRQTINGLPSVTM